MKRPNIYIATLILAVAAGVGLVVWLRPSLPVMVLMVGVCLLPGRVQGILWRDFFHGRRALETGAYSEALKHFESFRKRLEHKPGLAKAIYLAGSAYTWDAHAMVLSNIGATRLSMGDTVEAGTSFHAAADRDCGYAIPVFNLAVLAQFRGDDEAAETLRRRARDLGYSGGTRDRLIQQAGAALAAVEGRTSRSEGARTGV